MRNLVIAAVVVVAVVILAAPLYTPDTVAPNVTPPGDNSPGTDPGTEPAGDPWEGKETVIRTETFSRGTLPSKANGEWVWLTETKGLNQIRLLSVSGSFELEPGAEFAAMNIEDWSKPLTKYCVAFQYWNASELTSTVYYSFDWQDLYLGNHDMYPPSPPWENVTYPPICDRILLRSWADDSGGVPYIRNWHLTVTYEALW